MAFPFVHSEDTQMNLRLAFDSEGDDELPHPPTSPLDSFSPLAFPQPSVLPLPSATGQSTPCFGTPTSAHARGLVRPTKPNPPMRGYQHHHHGSHSHGSGHRGAAAHRGGSGRGAGGEIPDGGSSTNPSKRRASTAAVAVERGG
eukprot:RCo024218